MSMVQPTERVSSIDLDAYVANGFCVVRGLFPADDVTSWRSECERLFRVVPASGGLHARQQFRAHVAGGVVFDRLDPVIDLSTTFRRLADDERLMGLARSALGGAPVLLKDKLIVKAPGTMGYAMHQDYQYWVALGIPADAIVTIMVSIDAAGPHNGAPELFPGLHHQALPALPEEPRDIDESQMDLRRGEVIETAAGDVLLFHSLVPHRSGANHSSRDRRVVLFTYTQWVYGDAYRAFYEYRDRATTSP